MVNEMPLVSVLMTAYNREKYIAEAIESVLASTYKNFELIIVDDKSHDSTVSIARVFANSDQRIKIFVNENNLGDYPNRNKAASYAIGEYLMNVDSDDTIYPETIEKVLKIILQEEGANFGMSIIRDEYKKAFFLDKKKAIHEHFFGKPFLLIGPGGTIIKRSFFNTIGGYPVKYGPANDMYFNLKATSISGIVLMPWHFVYYRLHEGQEINNSYSYLFNTYRYLNDALREINLNLEKKELEWLSKKNKRRFVTNIYHYFLKSKNLKLTFNAIKKAEFKSKDFFTAIFH